MNWRRELHLYLSRLLVIRFLVEILVLIVYIALALGVVTLAMAAGLKLELVYLVAAFVPYLVVQGFRTVVVYGHYPPKKRLWGWFKWLEDTSRGIFGEGSVILGLRVIGAGLIAYGLIIFAWQIGTYLKHGVWHELSMISLLSEDTANLIQNPTDWIGLANLLNLFLRGVPMSFITIAVGILIFVLPKDSPHKSDLDDLV